MKKQKLIKRIFALGLCSVLALGMITGCGAGENQKDSQPTDEAVKAEETADETVNEKENSEGTEKEGEQETPMKAVYLENEYGAGVFVELENESPFFGTIPTELYEEDETVISQEDIKSGDVFEIYGNQIMLNSYPGQYPGITKMVRLEKENQTYVEKYREYLEQFCPEPDTTQPPLLSVEYRQPEAIITAAVEMGGYEWTSTQENGETATVIADSLHVLAWDDQFLAEMKLSEETEFRTLFTYEPLSVEVLRWSESEREKAKDSAPLGEAVTVEQDENSFTFKGEAGYVYEVIGTWKEGTVHYGFFTTEKE